MSSDPFAEAVDEVLREEQGDEFGDQDSFAEAVDEVLAEERQGHGEATRLRGSLISGLKEDPDRAVQDRRTADAVGLTPRIVGRDRERHEGRLRLEKIDPEGLARDAPITARALSDHSFASIAHDDVENLSYWERFRSDVGQGFDVGDDTRRLGNLGTQAFLGLAEEDDELTIAALQSRQARRRDFGIGGEGVGGFIEGVPTAAAEFLPLMLESVGAGAAVGLPAAGAGALLALAAGQAGPQAAAPEELVTVPASALAFGTKGFTVGMTANMAKAELGLAFLEFRDLELGDGETIPEDLARAMAVPVGVLNALLERIGLGAILKRLPGGSALFGRGAVTQARQALQRPGFRRVIRDLIAGTTEAGLVEGLTEGAQEAVNIAFGQLGVGLASFGALIRPETSEGIPDFTHTVTLSTGEEVELRGFDAVLARVLQAARKGAQGGAGLGGASTATGIATDIGRAQRAQATARQIEQDREKASESKLRKRDPEAFRQHVQNVANENDSIPSTVYVPEDRVRELFQAMAPEELQSIVENVPELRGALAESVATGADLAIPFEDYQTWIAPTSLGEALTPDLRYDPREMTQREAEAFEASLIEGGLIGEAAEPTVPDALRQRQTEVETELAKVHGPEAARRLAEFTVRDRILTRAERSGRSVEEILAEERLQVETPGRSRPDGAPEPSLELGLERAAVTRVLGDLRANREPELRGLPERPVLSLLRDLGGIDPGSPFGADLASIVPRSGAGSVRSLFREGGLRGIDDLDLLEEPVFRGNLQPAGEGSARVDPNAVLEAIREELLGRPLRTEEQAEAIAAGRQEREGVQAALQARGLDLETLSDADLAEALVPDDDAVDSGGLESDTIVAEGGALYEVDTRDDGASERDAALGGPAAPVLFVAEGTDAPDSPAGDAAAPQGPRVRAVQTGTFRTGITRLETAEDVAHLTAPLRKQAQESVLVVITDEDGDSLGVIRHTTGTSTESLVSLAAALGPAFELPGAARLWMVHNHPSGDPVQSREDGQIRSRIENALRGSGIEFEGSVVVAPGGRASVESEIGVSREFEIPGAVRDGTVAVLERRFRRIAQTVEAVRTPEDVLEHLRAAEIAEDGLLFLSGRNQPVGFIEMSPEEMERLRSDDVHRGIGRILREASELNASSFMAILGDAQENGAALQNLSSFGAVSGLRLLDAIDPLTRTSAQRSGTLPEPLRTFFQGPVTEGPTRIVAAVVARAEDGQVDAFQGRNHGEAMEAAEAAGVPAEELTHRDHFLVSDGRVVDRFGASAEFDVSASEQLELEVEPGQVVLEQPGPTEPRGSTRFDPELEQVVIRLTEAADLSTYLHESGHLWLEQLGKDAARDDASEQLREDWRIAREWLGVDEGGELGTEQHEQWARGFEAYLFEGKAPSLELQSVFARFSAWLTRIYKRLRTLGVELTPEIREVFDRLVATDAAIEQARSALSLEPLFSEQEAAGMTPAEFAEYQALTVRARDEAAVQLQSDLLAQVAKQKTEEWKRRRVQVRQEIEAEVNDRPVFQAKHFLQHGEFLVGEMPEGLEPVKLGRDHLVEAYGKEILKLLPGGRFGVWAIEGVHPDVVAELFGFDSGDQLVKALQASGNRKAVIEQETDARMRDRFGELKTSGEIEEAALVAAANPQQLNALAVEERALAKRVGGQEAPAQVLRRAAQRIVSERRVRDLQPHRDRMAAQREGRKALDAMAAGDLVAAQAAKRKQLLNLHLEAETRKAREAADQGLRFLRTFGKRSVRQQLGKAGPGFVEQVDELLARFELRVSLRQTERLQSLSDWLTERELAGDFPQVDPRIREETQLRKHYKLLTVEEFRAVVDSVRNIDHMARAQLSWIEDGEEQEFEEARGELINSALLHIDQKEPSKRLNPSRLEQLRSGLLSAASDLTKMEFVIDRLDGLEADGPWRRFVWRPIAEAEARRNDMNKEYTQRFDELMTGLLKGKGAEYGRIRDIPELHTEMTKLELLALALNTGNHGNLRKLVEGRADLEWTTESVQIALDKHLGESDWRFVQSVWDLIETLWPAIAEQEKKLTGLVPEKVEARDVVTPFGRFRGGYYPVIYDPDKARFAFKHAQHGLYEGLENNFARPVTGHGFTEERTRVVGPLLLDLRVIPSHLDQVILDLTHREILQRVDRLTDHASIAGALESTVGQAEQRLFRPWLQGIAKDRMVDSRALKATAAVLRGLRTRVTVFTLGFRWTTLAVQPSGHSNAIRLLQERLPNWKHHYIEGIRKASGGLNPTRMQQAYEEALATSGLLRHRIGHIDRDTRDVIRRHAAAVSQESVTGKVVGFVAGEAAGEVAGAAASRVNQKLDNGSRMAMELIGRVQLFSVDLPVWFASYNGAVEELGLEHQAAVDFADQIVSMSQGSAGAKDLSAIQRGDEGIRQFLLFFSYMNTVWNQMSTAGRQVKSVRDVPKFLASTAHFLLYPAILSALLRGKLPDLEDDDEVTEMLLWVTRLLGREAAGTIPGIRDIASTFEFGSSGGATPLGRLGQAVLDAKRGQDEVEWMFDLLRVAGLARGLPLDSATRGMEKLIEED